MNNKNSGPGNNYSIRVKGTIVPSSLEWFSGLAITPLSNGDTLMIGWFPDQPALRGLCEYLWNLNITIQSLGQLEIENQTVFSE